MHRAQVEDESHFLPSRSLLDAQKAKTKHSFSPNGAFSEVSKSSQLLRGIADKFRSCISQVNLDTSPPRACPGSPLCTKSPTRAAQGVHLYLLAIGRKGNKDQVITKSDFAAGSLRLCSHVDLSTSLRTCLCLPEHVCITGGSMCALKSSSEGQKFAF